MEHFLWETNLKEIVENKWETVQVELLRHHICECFLLLLTIHSRQSKCRVVFSSPVPILKKLMGSVITDIPFSQKGIFIIFLVVLRINLIL